MSGQTPLLPLYTPASSAPLTGSHGRAGAIHPNDAWINDPSMIRQLVDALKGLWWGNESDSDDDSDDDSESSIEQSESPSRNYEEPRALEEYTLEQEPVASGSGMHIEPTPPTNLNQNDPPPFVTQARPPQYIDLAGSYAPDDTSDEAQIPIDGVQDGLQQWRFLGEKFVRAYSRTGDKVLSLAVRAAMDQNSSVRYFFYLFEEDETTDHLTFEDWANENSDKFTSVLYIDDDTMNALRPGELPPFSSVWWNFEFNWAL